MLFDTSIVIDVLKKLRPYEYGSISTITLLETIRGTDESKMTEVLVSLQQMYQIYDLDNSIVLAYSRLYRKLKEGKVKIGDADLIIAATAYAKGEVLKTKDSDFDVLLGILDIRKEH